MGIRTVYFTAPETSLKLIFPGWSPPKRVTRKFVNPFTRKAQTIRTLVPRDGAASIAPRIPSRRPQFERKFLLPDAFRPLLGGCADAWPRDGADFLAVEDATAKDKPTKLLVDPMLMGSEEEVLHRLPTVLVEALASLQAERVKNLATAWSKALTKAKVPYAPSPKDAVEVLVELGKLGRAASRDGSDVYAYTH